MEDAEVLRRSRAYGAAHRPPFVGGLMIAPSLAPPVHRFAFKRLYCGMLLEEKLYKASASVDIPTLCVCSIWLQEEKTYKGRYRDEKRLLQKYKLTIMQRHMHTTVSVRSMLRSVLTKTSQWTTGTTTWAGLY